MTHPVPGVLLDADLHDDGEAGRQQAFERFQVASRRLIPARLAWLSVKSDHFPGADILIIDGRKIRAQVKACVALVALPAPK